MGTNPDGQHKDQVQPEEPHTWRKILRLVSQYGEHIRDVEEATGHKYEPREWVD